jgi:hypothetical protein
LAHPIAGVTLRPLPPRLAVHRSPSTPPHTLRTADSICTCARLRRAVRCHALNRPTGNVGHNVRYRLAATRVAGACRAVAWCLALPKVTMAPSRQRLPNALPAPPAVCPRPPVISALWRAVHTQLSVTARIVVAVLKCTVGAGAGVDTGCDAIGTPATAPPRYRRCSVGATSAEPARGTHRTRPRNAIHRATRADSVHQFVAASLRLSPQ